MNGPCQILAIPQDHRMKQTKDTSVLSRARLIVLMNIGNRESRRKSHRMTLQDSLVPASQDFSILKSHSCILNLMILFLYFCSLRLLESCYCLAIWFCTLAISFS
ncbi:hypothetical protein PM082_023631 [Marasmius tenuissimus]|nr:hypothetical protein PM082_023631 [Marasmius tenuissimus]